jgi:hypothetical protein
MKRLIKKMLKAMWQKTAFLRRPIVRRLDHKLDAILQQVIEKNLATTLQRFETTNNCLIYEVNLVLNSVVRELARLQMEVETLQQMVEDLGSHRSGLSIVSDNSGEGLYTERTDDHVQAG